MEKIHKSIVLTKWFTVFWAVFFAVCVLLGHRIAAVYLLSASPRSAVLGPFSYGALLVLGYTCGLSVLYLLYRLYSFLTNMEHGYFFTEENIRHLRTVSALFAGIAAVTALTAVFYSLFFLTLSFAALFLSLIVHIVASIFVQAASMKDELDLTV